MTENLRALDVIVMSVGASVILALIGIYLGSKRQIKGGPAAIWTIICFVPFALGALDLTTAKAQVALSQPSSAARANPAAG